MCLFVLHAYLPAQAYFSQDLLSAALVLLLKEKSPEVRKKSAYALSMLTNY